MRFKNKFNIDLFDNQLRKDPKYLLEKNCLEAAWYDQEAESYITQLNNSDGLTLIDSDFEEWFASFFDNDSASFPYDRDYAFFKLFPKLRDTQILELGCGNGCLSRFFIRRDFAIFSIDISKICCGFLKKSEPRSNPLKSCAEILPFKNNSFDIITAFVALHHFNLDLSLSEMNRVLKAGGRGIFIEPLSNSRLLYQLRQLIPVADNESPGGGGLRESELKQKLETHGFDFHIVEYELITRFERLPLAAGFQKFFRKIDYFLFTHLPFLRYFARTAVIEIIKRR